MGHSEDPNTAPARDDLLSAEDFLSLPSETLAEGERGRIDATRMGAVDLLVLRFDTAVAVVSRFGAQVLAHRPAGRPDTLFTSSLARFDTGAAIRGGIPVCWPWFGPASTPQHGWARLHTWEVEALTVDGTGAEVRLGFSHRGAAAGLTVRLADGLSVELAHRADPVPETAAGTHLRAVRAPGATPAAPELPVTAALHAYFAVGDAQRTEIAGVTDRTLRVPAEGIDSVFPLAGTAGTAAHRIAITDPALGRRLTVTTNASDAVVWNPAQQLGDTTAAAHHGFVCVEPARISSPLTPGDTLRMHLAVD